jgi:hypothetical protein
MGYSINHRRQKAYSYGNKDKVTIPNYSQGFNTTNIAINCNII